MLGDKEYVYVVISVFSGYKEELHDSNINTQAYRSYDKACTMMVKIAEEIYEESDIIQETDDKYFEVYNNAIYFGENQSYGIGYRSEWGLVKIEKVKLE